MFSLNTYEVKMARIIFILAILISYMSLTCFNAYSGNSSRPGDKVKTRPAAVAGSFYPGKTEDLKKAVDILLKNSGQKADNLKIFAAMAPHAGYVFSGRIAALTFKNIADIDFDTIIIIGHDSFGDAVAYTCPVDYFETPLGKMPVDMDMINKMYSYNKGIKPETSMHRSDHTIEIQLPFLQAMNKKCKILPVMFGYPSPENCKILADAIKYAAGDKKIFILASTDMSHYPAYEGANKMDNISLDMIRTMDIEKFFRHVYKQLKEPQLPGLQTAICASGGVGTAMLYAKEMGADTALVLRYANSGDVPAGDKKRVVGYSSVLFIKK